MSASVRVDWRGGQITAAVARHATGVLGDAAEFVLEESNRTVPIEESVLESSGSTDAAGDEAAIYYDTPYAVRLHENPQYNFQHGRRGKWLSLTMGEQRDRVQRYLAERMAEAFR